MAGTTDRIGGDVDDEAFDEAFDGTPQGHLSALPVAPRTRGLLLVIGGILGFVAAFTLTVERIKLAEDPGYVPSCSLNPIISCGNVMVTEQARVFGFPNPLIGIAAFAVSVFLGVLVLSRVALPRWVERGYLVGITLGAVFVGWLISQSLYWIHALCPYCMVVWAVVIPTFWTHVADGLDRGLIPVPRGLRGAARVVVDYRALLVVLSYLAVVAMVGTKFWSYWQTLL
ncbi:vitamin K epoxide reductase family protein [Kineococcus rhizosphaerae]|uniref:Putative membrane protein n=1 Tax=Kineococcus rhizosphaerae TaxID=559628 RepID=A0A2T0R3Z9_9ACTN|nr:vitamin K epoxide reductase family protein [Kineococcus rhizosphaerae]PRY15098.1 putative membrane protein [Kineococcus rhizosphaerae]